MTIIRTGGVNYEPPEMGAANPATGEIELMSTGPEDVITSTLHLEMRIRAEMNGREIELVSGILACGTGCRQLTNPGDPESRVEILRLAKDGFDPIPGSGVRRLVRDSSRVLSRVGLPSAGVRWLVTMEDGALMAGVTGPLQGNTTQGPTAERNKYPQFMLLHGRMVLRTQVIPMGKASTLRSRIEPRFTGEITGWPPRGDRLHLENGPIPYYEDEDVDRADSAPILTVLSNDIRFGTEEVSLLSVTPEITSARVVAIDPDAGNTGSGDRGVHLTWTDTRNLVAASDPPVRFYNVYRRYEGDTTNGWVHIRNLPAHRTEWIDRGFDGRTADYVVLHAAEYPFGYRYESLVGPAVRVSTDA